MLLRDTQTISCWSILVKFPTFPCEVAVEDLLRIHHSSTGKDHPTLSPILLGRPWLTCRGDGPDGEGKVEDPRKAAKILSTKTKCGRPDEERNHEKRASVRINSHAISKVRITDEVEKHWKSCSCCMSSHLILMTTYEQHVSDKTIQKSPSLFSAASPSLRTGDINVSEKV